MLPEAWPVSDPPEGGLVAKAEAGMNEPPFCLSTVRLLHRPEWERLAWGDLSEEEMEFETEV